jgi:hypothetical protein
MVEKRCTRVEEVEFAVAFAPTAAGSSKGRTAAFEAAYLGSIPSPAAVFTKVIRSTIFNFFFRSFV